MMVNITAAEYEAIQFCCEQVTSAVEGTSNEQYVAEANEAVNNIAVLSRKYHTALAKKDKKVLHLSVNKQWFDMIANGQKNEEYREIKQYWISRLLCGHYDVPWLLQFGENMSEDLYWKEYTHVVFTHGYGDDKPHVEKQIASISIGKPQKGLCPEEWLNKSFFVIKFI